MLEPGGVATGTLQLKWERNYQQYLILHMLCNGTRYVCTYHSLINECPWVDLLKSLPMGRSAYLSVSTFNHERSGAHIRFTAT